MGKGLAAMVLCALGLAACGGPEDYEISGARGDTHGASADIIQACGLSGGDPDEVRMSKRVDIMLAAHEDSDGDAEVESTMKEAAAYLRQCGMDSLADRLNDVTDE